MSKLKQPATSPKQVQGGAPSEPPATPARAIMLGVLAGVLGAFPAGALLGLVFRFPIPFGGYESGLDAVFPSLFAVLFYGLIGGFLVVGALGGLGGFLAYRSAQPDRKSVLRLTLIYAFLGDLAAGFILSILDKIIGPW